jgi:peptidoglycan/LPS O-acetylase OafA/YrhL
MTLALQEQARTALGTEQHGYRPDIDGLRAIAVLSVMFFHAGFSWSKGGYAGVDVFFVISGYLITSILLKEHAHGSFSIVKFYERRARRILPTLFCVLFVSSLLALQTLTPAQTWEFARSLVYVGIFGSNILFRQSVGYFDVDAEEKPLLHTWSLGVEEQFYVAFPLILAFLWPHGRRRLFWILALAALISLAMCEHGSRRAPAATFYLIPTRAWELLLGALTALAAMDGPLHRRVGRLWAEVLADLGLIMVLGAMVLLGRATPFPSLYALLPAGGAALAIGFSHEKTLAARLLSLKPLVGIGLISYSAYLWRHPLFAYGRIITLDALAPSDYGWLIVASLALALATWKFVETPFRDRARFSPREIVLLSVSGSLFFIILGAALQVAGGDAASRKAKRPNYGLHQECDFDDHFEARPVCRTSDAPEIMVWGDSFAMHLVPGLLASNGNSSIVQATKSACGPFPWLGPTFPDGRHTETWARGCLTFNEDVLSYIQAHPSLRVVAISSPFHHYVDHGWTFVTRSEGRRSPSPALALEQTRKLLLKLRDYGKKVVVIGPPPNAEFNVGNCVERKLAGKPAFGPRASCALTTADYTSRNKTVLDFLDALRRENLVNVIRLDEALCDETLCATTLGNTPLYRDSGHLSYDGSAALGKKMDWRNLIMAKAM